MSLFRFLRGLAACAILVVSFACKGKNSGSTAGTALYTFDGATKTIMVWNDLESFYDATSTPAPARTISADLIGSQIANLGWGGMCLDPTRGVLYLVSDSGNIIRIARIRNQNGTISGTSTDLVSFSLSTTGRLTNGKFGQAAVDPQTDTLYITESGDSSTQIWVVSGASSQPQNATISLKALQVSGDTGGTGVAAGQGVVYGFYLSGNPVSTVGSDALTGPRLRKGSSSGFTANNVIIGGSTGLGQYGSLALDYGNAYLFVARHNTDAGATGAPVGVFQTGQFGLTFNQAPVSTVGDAAEEPDLRVIAHPGNKDWLVGLRGSGSTAYNTLILWKSPLGGTAAKAVTVSPSTTEFYGVALDGDAS
jgi:hypothetical protein